MGLSLVRKVLATTIPFCVIVAGLHVPNVKAALSDLSVEWSTTDNTTVSGVFTIAARARSASTGTATIKKWCLTVDGSPVTSDVGVNDATYSEVGYYGTFDAETGCWSSSSVHLRSAQFQWDSTAWANGSHTYAVTVTDTSNRTATSTTITVSVANTAPSVEWSTTDNTTVSGVFTIAARARSASTGTATIKKWCLTVDGSPVTSDVGVNDATYSEVGYYGTFDAETGCWSSSSVHLRSAQFQWDSTAWANGSHTYAVTVTDTSNRTATSTTITLTRVDAPSPPSPGPTTAAVAWSETADKSVTGIFTLSARALGSTTPASNIKKWCLTVDGSPVTSNVAVNRYAYSDVGYSGTFNAETGCWSNSSYSLTSAQFRWDSTAWANGSHTYVVTVTDTSNRTATSPTLTINTFNYSPFVSWASGNNQTVSGTFTLAAAANPHLFGTANIKKWCLTVDGSPVTSNVAVNRYAYSDVGHSGTFNAETGCWSNSSTNLTSAQFRWDSTAWANGSHTYVVTVTDTSNRTATSPTLTINTFNYSPFVSWASGNNQTVSGTFTLAAAANPHLFGTANIKKWCLTVDGSPVTSNVAVNRYAYSDVGHSGTFNAETGCWSNSSTNLTSAQFRWDSLPLPPWVNGSHTYVITVTDTSNRTATSTTLTVTVANTAPSVEWSTTNNRTVSGIFTVAASARTASTGNATINKWCLLIRKLPGGTYQPVKKDYATGGDVDYFGTFNATTGCWTSRYGYGDLTTGTFRIPTAAWTDSSRVLKILVTDTSGRPAQTNLTFTTKNPQPTKQVVGLSPGATVTGDVTAKFVIKHPGASSITTWCLRVRTTTCFSSGQGRQVGNTSTQTISFDTSLWPNGTYKAIFEATDSEGRKFDSGSISFRSNNPGASATVPTIANNSPVWSDTSVSATVSTTSKNATNLFVYLGTSANQLWEFPLSRTYPSQTFIGLEPRTVYYVKVKAVGPNGTSETALVTFTSASIPSPPPPSGGGGSGGGSSGYGWTVFKGWNLEDYQDEYGYDPATFDCTGRGRTNLWSRNWWIVGIRNRVFAISKSRSGCS